MYIPNTTKSTSKYLKRAIPEVASLRLVKIPIFPELEDKLVEYEKQTVIKRYKFGVLYVTEGQTDEDAMFSNGMDIFKIDIFRSIWSILIELYVILSYFIFIVNPSSEYEEFLNFLGERITLQGWTKYRGGLDVKSKLNSSIDISLNLR